MAAALGRAEVVPHRRPCRQTAAQVHPRHVLVPVRRPPHGSCRGVRSWRCARSLLAAAGIQRAAPHRLGLFWASRRERRDQTWRRSPRVDLCKHRAAVRVDEGIRHLGGLGPGDRHERPGVLQVEPVAVSQDVRKGPRLPQGFLGQLGSGRPDRARERAGAPRWHLRSLRCHRREEEAHPVVFQDHRLCRPPARRPQPARGLVAAKGARDAAQLDRALQGRGRRLRDRRTGGEDHRLHHSPGHPVRSDLHGRRARF